MRKYARAGDARTRLRGGRARRDVRKLRPPNGNEARSLRTVPRLHRLSRVQDDEKDHHDEARDDRGKAGSDPRREMSEVRIKPRAEAWTIRRVHRVQQLSRLQVRQAEVHPPCLSEGWRRRRRAEIQTGKGVLWLRQLPGLRFRAVE